MKLTAGPDGELLAVAYGCQCVDSGLHAGILFVRAGIASPTQRFWNHETQEYVLLNLPEDALNLPQNGRAYSVLLCEVS